jgi:hypothetical protein
VRSRQRDIRTRGAVGIANSYSASGGVFGYQIGPRLRGLEDPAEGGRAAEVLERQSFPVLILLGIDASDLRPRLRWDQSSKHLEVFEPQITFLQTQRWIPLRRPWYSFGGLFTARLSEAERIAWHDELRRDKTAKTINAARERLHVNTAELLRQREYALLKQALGSQVTQALPLELIMPVAATPKIPQPTEIIPNRVTLKRDGSGNVLPERIRFVVLGSDLETIVVERLSVVSGKANFVKDKNFTPQLVNGTLRMTLEVSGGDPIMLRLPINPRHANLPGRSEEPSVLTPVVTVTIQ